MTQEIEQLSGWHWTLGKTLHEPALMDTACPATSELCKPPEDFT